MKIKSDPTLMTEIRKYGKFNTNACLQCGSCTVVCALTNNSTATFPRRPIQYALMGLKDLLKRGLEPWLCYYCGDCSTTCPRQTEPGEAMMTFRRYLTAQYDWTGLSRRMYLSKAWEIGALAVLALGIFLMFYFGGSFSRMGGDHVSVNTFAPVHWVHYGDWAMAAILAFFLLSNAGRMVYFHLRSEPGLLKLPLSVWAKELKTFILHGVTQMRWRVCSESENGGLNLRWLKHLLLVIGYATMLVLVVFLLPIFQRDDSAWHWTAIPGYYGTAILLYFTADAMYGRWKKKEEMHKHSHSTDWIFLILLFFTALTGILLHLFRLVDLTHPTYYMYVIHLMIAVSMLIIEVPFGKWAHLLYRPLAIYIQTVKEHALTEQFKKEEQLIHAA